MAKVRLNVSLPDALLQPFLQHVRNYETQHFKDVALEIFVTDNGKLQSADMVRIFESIEPPYTYRYVIKPGASH